MIRHRHIDRICGAAILLALIGVLFYKDLLLPRQCIGIALCLLGIFFLHG